MSSSTPETQDQRFSLASHPAFFRLWLSRGMSGIAYQMLVVAIGWQLYSLTNSARDLGLVGLAQFVPMFLVTPVAGHVADSFDRRRVVAICQVISALAGLALAFGTVGGWLGRFEIFGLVALLSMARAFEFPTISALLALLVPRENLTQATALYSSANQTAIILGPALGGLIYMLHPSAAYFTAAALALVAATQTLRIDAVMPDRKREAITFETISAGVRFIRRTPEILGAISLDLFAVILGATAALLPIFARDILGTGPWGLGLLRAAPAVGALSMAVFLAYHPIRRHAGPKMFGAVALFGLSTIVFGVSTSLALSLVALVVMGASDVVSVVVRQSLVQVRTPDEMRGRVGAVNAMFISSSNQLGDFRAGEMAAAIGVVPAVIAGGIGAIVTAGLWAVLFPSLRTLERAEK